MGTTSASTFSDDTAQDVRETWIEVFRATASAKLAIAEVRKEFRSEFKDADDGPVATLALALTLWKYGCLDAATRKSALRVIDKKQGLERWREQGAAAERARLKEYAKVKATLLSKQPASKQGTFKPLKKEDCGLQLGDIFSIPLVAGGRAHLRVIGQDKDRQAIRPIVELLDLPATTQSDGVNWRRVKPLLFRAYDGHDPNRRRDFAHSLWGWKARGWDRASVQVHGRVPVSAPLRKLLKKKFIQGRSWAHLPESAAASLDRSRWLSQEAALRKYRACKPGEIATLRPKIELAIRQTGQIWNYTTVPAYRIIRDHGDYQRAMAILDLAVTIDPKCESPVTRGHALLGLGDAAGAKATWQAEIKNSTDPKVKARIQREIEERKADVAARQAGGPGWKRPPEMKPQVWPVPLRVP